MDNTQLPTQRFSSVPAMQRKLVSVMAGAIALLFLAVYLLPSKTAQRPIPIPFLSQSSNTLAGSVIHVRTLDNGVEFYEMDFADDPSQTAHADTVYLIKVPANVSPLPFERMVLDANGTTRQYYGYLYTSITSATEIANSNAASFVQRFPGIFFASDSAKAAHGDDLEAFAQLNGITFKTAGATRTDQNDVLLTPTLIALVPIEDMTIGIAPVCGNGWKAETEACDDGNTQAGDGCSATCGIEDGFGCSGDPSNCTSLCGNGVLDSSDACDDGNLAPADGCSATCAVEAGFGCSGDPSTCVLLCGNGVLDANETCDDGNTQAGDGCSASIPLPFDEEQSRYCSVETGYLCDNEPLPSTCAVACGNGAIDPGEICDDGNTSADDGCSAACNAELVVTAPAEGSTMSRKSIVSGTCKTGASVEIASPLLEPSVTSGPCVDNGYSIPITWSPESDTTTQTLRVSQSDGADSVLTVRRAVTIQPAVVSIDSFPRIGSEVDDTNRTQRAVDALTDRGGGTLTLSDGTYSITYPIFLRETTNIVGASRSDTIISTPVPTHCFEPDGHVNRKVFDLFLVTGVPDVSVSFRDITLRRNAMPCSGSKSAIRMDYDTTITNGAYSGANLRVENVTIEGFDIGVYVSGGSDLLVNTVAIVDSEIVTNPESAGGGNSVTPTLNINNVREMTVTGNTLTAHPDGQRNNLYSIGVQRATVSGNTITNGVGAKFGTNPFNGSDSILIQDNTFKQNTMPMLFFLHQNNINSIDIARNAVLDSRGLDPTTGDITFTNYPSDTVNTFHRVALIENEFRNSGNMVFLANLGDSARMESLTLRGNTYAGWSLNSPGTYRAITHGSQGGYGTISLQDERADGGGTGRRYFGACSFDTIQAVNSPQETNVTQPSAGGVLGCP